MSTSEYTTDYETIRTMAITELANPEHRLLLLRFATEVAVPCVAEAFMSVLERAHRPTIKHPFPSISTAKQS